MNRAIAQQSPDGKKLHREDWCTPGPIIRGFYHAFRVYQMGLDPCWNPSSPVMARTKWRKKALQRSWRGYGPVFGNFPYTRGKNGLTIWMRHAYENFKNLREDDEDGLGLLLPSSTDTEWFHDYLLKLPDVTVCFLRGRVRHVHPDTGRLGGLASFPSLVAHCGRGADRFRSWFCKRGALWMPTEQLVKFPRRLIVSP